MTPRTRAHQALLSSTISRSLLKLTLIESVMVCNLLIFCCIRVFVDELALAIRWPKYWNFSFSICPSSEYSWLTSFRIDWCDLLAVQGSLKSLLQDHSTKASILRCSIYLMVQLSHSNMTTGMWVDGKCQFVAASNIEEPWISGGAGAPKERRFTQSGVRG